PCTITQKRAGSWAWGMIADTPRWPGGCFDGSFQSFAAGCASSVLLSAQLLPPSRLSNTPLASPPASRRPCAAAIVEIFDSLSPPSPWLRPSLESSHVSPRSLERHTATPCHSLAAAA